MRLFKLFLFLVLLSSAISSFGLEEEKPFIDYQNGNYQEAFPALLNLAKQGNVKAESLVGRMYVFGLGVPQDLNAALTWSLLAGQQGDPLSQNILGVIYENGWGVARDQDKAVDWYKKSAAQNFLFAQKNLADLYFLRGTGKNKNIKEAANLYQLAAENGDEKSPVMLSALYKKLGGSQNIKKAFSVLVEYADKGNILAMAALGDEYYYGSNVEKNYPEAAKWYELASDKLNAHSQYMLGTMYFNGIGVPKDITHSITLYKLAAKSKNVYALNELGRIYEDGIGIRRLNI